MSELTRANGVALKATTSPPDSLTIWAIKESESVEQTNITSSASNAVFLRISKNEEAFSSPPSGDDAESNLNDWSPTNSSSKISSSLNKVFLSVSEISSIVCSSDGLCMMGIEAISSPSFLRVDSSSLDMSQ